MHFAATGAMHGHGLLYLTPTAFNHLGPTHRAHPHTAAGLQTPITGRFVVLGLPDLNVLVMGANAQAFCSSGIGEDVAGNRLSAKRSTRRTMGFSEVARNFALLPVAPAPLLPGRTRLPLDRPSRRGCAWACCLMGNCATPRGILACS